MILGSSAATVFFFKSCQIWPPSAKDTTFIQGLIAHEDLKFYGRDWNVRGTKTSLREEIADITGTDAAILADEYLLHTSIVAKRILWAPYRQTIRGEDQAHSLLGILDFNMPMLYWEGV